MKKQVKNIVENPYEGTGVELSKSLPTFDVPIDLIIPNPLNPNDMDNDTFDRLVEEMDSVGMIDPVLIAPSEEKKFMIIGGEHRWRGAKTLGWKTIPCNILTDDIDDDLKELIMVRLNVIKGKINPEKFAVMYNDRVRKYGADQLKALFGYTSSDAWKKVTKGIEDALRSSGLSVSSEMADEIKKRSKNIKSIDGLGSILKSLYKEYGSDLSHNFMVFTYGGKRHVYVIMNDELHGTMEEIMSLCRKEGTDINSIVNGLLLKHEKKAN